MNRDEDHKRKALEIHRRYGGKISISSKVPIENADDFNVFYTPGVAAVSAAVSDKPELVYELTGKQNSVAIISDGSRVLGLGNIGPKAALPVMEGKALLFKYLGDVDAFPLCVSCETTDQLVDLVRRVAPTFGGINLEDIESPKCFEVHERLADGLEIPVFHDDQHGTSVIVLAALMNALAVVGKKMSESQIAVFGAGAAGIPTVRLLLHAGASPEKMLICDSRGIVNDRRTDLNPYKRRVAKMTNPQGKEGDLRDALRDADVLIALSKSGPWIPRDWVKDMCDDPIIFALANPVPEIWPEDAKQEGAKIVATGRGDFPNQVNNCLVFPSFFRGMLEVMARSFNLSVLHSAALAIARGVGGSLSPERIVPTIDEVDVFVETATQVALESIRQGLARIAISQSELEMRIEKRISKSRTALELLMRAGLV